MADFTLKIVGKVPLLMHSARLSDPLDEATKELAKFTSKRKKTEDDHVEVARLEHRGSLYWNATAGPYMPGENVAACLFRAASKLKLMSTLKPALIITSEVNPLAYAGPRDIEGLWMNKAFVHRASVTVGQQRVIRTRPVFTPWSVTVEGELDTEAVDRDQFVRIVEIAGRSIGLGDWRPRFGRFDPEVKFA